MPKVVRLGTANLTATMKDLETMTDFEDLPGWAFSVVERSAADMSAWVSRPMSVYPGVRV